MGDEPEMIDAHDSMPEPPEPAAIPLSRPVELASLATEREIHVTATPAECGAVAAAFGLPGISALSGRFAITPEHGGRFRVRLDLDAAVTQTCVVTLEPVDQHVVERALLVLMPREAAAQTEEDPDEPDIVPISGKRIDFGALLTEQLALALDPYPRKSDAELPQEAQEHAANPFASLAALRNIKK